MGTKLSVCALATAGGLTSGLSVLTLGLLANHWQIGMAWLTTLASVYVGFAPTFKGIMIGIGWGFLSGFISGLVIAVIYNFSLKVFCHHHGNAGK